MKSCAEQNLDAAEARIKILEAAIKQIPCLLSDVFFTSEQIREQLKKLGLNP